MLRNPGLLSLGPLFHFVWFSLVTAPGYSSPSSPCYLLDLKQDHSIPGFQPPGASIRSRIQPGSLLGRAAAASPSSFPAHLSNRPAFSPPMSRALPLLPLAPIHHRIFPDFQTTLTYWPGSALWSQVCFLSPTSRISAWWSQGLCLVHAAFPAPSMVPDTQKVIKKGFLINRCYSAFIKERDPWNPRRHQSYHQLEKLLDIQTGELLSWIPTQDFAPKGTAGHFTSMTTSMSM